MGSLAYGPT